MNLYFYCSRQLCWNNAENYRMHRVLMTAFTFISTLRILEQSFAGPRGMFNLNSQYLLENEDGIYTLRSFGKMVDDFFLLISQRTK